MEEADRFREFGSIIIERTIENFKDLPFDFVLNETEFEDEKYPESKLDAEKVKDILSDDYIAAVAAENEAKNAAKDAIAKAKEALDAAEEAGVPVDSDAYKAAKDYYDQAQKDFDDGKYDSAKENADKAVEAISGDEVKKILDKKAAEEALENAKKAIEDAKAAGISEDDPLYKKALEYGREKDDWITERMEACDSNQQENSVNVPEAKIIGLWALNANPYDMSGNSYGNDSSIIIHCHIQVNNMNGRKGIAILTMSTNGVSFNKTEPLEPNYDSCTWQDFRFPIYANDITNLVTKGQYQFSVKVDLFDDNNVCMVSSSIFVNIKYSTGLFSGTKVEIV